MTSRQSIAQIQRNDRFHPTHTIAPHVLASTIVTTKVSAQVTRVRLNQDVTRNNVTIKAGEHCYLVASKFAHRYYLVSLDLRSSAADRDLAASHKAAVQAYSEELKRL